MIVVQFDLESRNSVLRLHLITTHVSESSQTSLELSCKQLCVSPSSSSPCVRTDCLDCLTPLVCGSHLSDLEAMSEQPAGTQPSRHTSLPAAPEELPDTSKLIFPFRRYLFQLVPKLSAGRRWICVRVRTTHHFIVLRVAGTTKGRYDNSARVIMGQVEC